MKNSPPANFYVVYAEPLIVWERGVIKSMYQVPVSHRHHVDIQSAKKEYDELSAKTDKLLGLVETVSANQQFFVEITPRK